MAQGTVDKRFLTTFKKATSARIILALVVAAPLLAGCGGGSSDSSEAPGSTAAANGAAGEAAAGTGADAPSAGTEAGTGTGAGSGTGGSGGASGQPSSGAKQGPRVPQPTGEPAPKITPAQREEAIVANLRLESPSSLPSGGGPPALPAQYTCDGKNTSPALRWQGVPQGTAELVLFAMNIQPVDGKLFFDWAVAGLSPELEEIKAGELPRGAVVGRNSFGQTGYGICPGGEGETYMFTLFALPKKLSSAKGFEPLALRKAVHDSAGQVGLLALNYARG